MEALIVIYAVSVSIMVIFFASEFDDLINKYKSKHKFVLATAISIFTPVLNTYFAVLAIQRFVEIKYNRMLKLLGLWLIKELEKNKQLEENRK